MRLVVHTTLSVNRKLFCSARSIARAKILKSLRHCSREFALPAFFPPLSLAATQRPQIHPALSPAAEKSATNPALAHWEGRVASNKAAACGKNAWNFSANFGLFVTRGCPFLAVSILLFHCSSASCCSWVPRRPVNYDMRADKLLMSCAGSPLSILSLGSTHTRSLSHWCAERKLPVACRVS